MGALALALGIGIPLSVSAPALAEEGSWVFITPNGAVVPIQTAEDGTQFWDLQIQGTGNFISSWERKSGYWSSAATATEAANSRQRCFIAAKEAYVNRFDSYEAFIQAPTSRREDKGDDTFTWWIEGDAEIDAAFAACKDESEWSSDQVTWSKDEATGIWTVRIPVSLYGPGTHNLFIQNLNTPDDKYFDPQCKSRIWDGSGRASMGCEYSRGYFERISVNVEYPMADAGHVIAGPKVSEKTWFDQGVYSDLQPINWDFFGNFQKFVGPAVATLGVTSVFAVLIALPTSLLESSLEANQSRVESMLKRLIPGYGRRKKEPAGNAQNAGSDEGKS